MSDDAGRSRRGRIGMPATLWLHEFGSQVWAAFGSPPYLVGSALQMMLGMSDREPEDVDVRVILTDAEYESWGLGDPKSPHDNPKWVSLVLAYSELGRRMTGLPIDFQIQQQTTANAENPGAAARSAIGMVPLRMEQMNAHRWCIPVPTRYFHCTGDCDRAVIVDEDGCCVACGADTDERERP